jgi:hypothetical protein
VKAKAESVMAAKAVSTVKKAISTVVNVMEKTTIK